jgi:hypothetical protein
MLLTVMLLSRLVSLVFAAPTVDRCVCLPSQSCWPSSSAWNSLNNSVAGKLQAVYPVARPCHAPTYDASACLAVATNFTNGTWKSEQIGSSTVKRIADGERWTATAQLGGQLLFESDLLYRFSGERNM